MLLTYTCNLIFRSFQWSIFDEFPKYSIHFLTLTMVESKVNGSIAESYKPETRLLILYYKID